MILTVGADLKDGMTHLLDVRVPGETFEGVEVTLTQKVVFDVDPDNTAVVGEFTILTDLPLVGLSPENIDLQEDYSPNTTVSVQSVNTSSDSRTHVVTAPIQLETWYSVSLAGMPGYRFDCTHCLVRPNERFIDVTVADETPYGFTLVLNPAVAGLATEALMVTNLDGPAPTIESFTTDDGGHTYHVKTQPLRNYDRYVVALEDYGYYFAPRNVSFDLIRIDRTNITDPRHDGFTLQLIPPVDGLTTENLTLVSQVTGEPVPIASIATVDGGETVRVDADLIPGHVYRIYFERPGYTDAHQIIYPPEAELAVSDLTSEGFTLSLSPTVPGLGPGDLVLSANTGGAVYPRRLRLSRQQTAAPPMMFRSVCRKTVGPIWTSP